MPMGGGRRVKDSSRIRKAQKLRFRQKTLQYFPRTIKNFPDIVNVPLDMNGHPMEDREVVESRRKLFAGYHTVYRVVLPAERGGFYLRTVVS